jgi:hypothetical protein
MNKICFFLLSAFLIIPSWIALAEESPQRDITTIIADFSGSEWGKVSLAEKQLMEMGKEW